MTAAALPAIAAAPDAVVNDLLAVVQGAAINAKNEAGLRHAIEAALGDACRGLGYAWSSFSLDLSLRGEPGQRFIDAVHGTLIIEYEPPRSFNGGQAAAVVRHAKGQAEEYADILSVEEGRDIADYTLCVWDGADLAFAQFAGGGVELGAATTLRRGGDSPSAGGDWPNVTVAGQPAFAGIGSRSHVGDRASLVAQAVRGGSCVAGWRNHENQPAVHRVASAVRPSRRH